MTSDLPYSINLIAFYAAIVASLVILVFVYLFAGALLTTIVLDLLSRRYFRILKSGSLHICPIPFGINISELEILSQSGSLIRVELVEIRLDIKSICQKKVGTIKLYDVAVLNTSNEFVISHEWIFKLAKYFVFFVENVCIESCSANLPQISIESGLFVMKHGDRRSDSQLETGEHTTMLKKAPYENLIFLERCSLILAGSRVHFNQALVSNLRDDTSRLVTLASYNICRVQVQLTELTLIQELIKSIEKSIFGKIDLNSIQMEILYSNDVLITIHTVETFLKIQQSCIVLGSNKLVFDSMFDWIMASLDSVNLSIRTTNENRLYADLACDNGNTFAIDQAVGSVNLLALVYSLLDLTWHVEISISLGKIHAIFPVESELIKAQTNRLSATIRTETDLLVSSADLSKILITNKDEECGVFIEKAVVEYKHNQEKTQFQFVTSPVLIAPFSSLSFLNGRYNQEASVYKSHHSVIIARTVHPINRPIDHTTFSDSNTLFISIVQIRIEWLNETSQTEYLLGDIFGRVDFSAATSLLHLADCLAKLIINQSSLTEYSTNAYFASHLKYSSIIQIVTSLTRVDLFQVDDVTTKPRHLVNILISPLLFSNSCHDPVVLTYFHLKFLIICSESDQFVNLTEYASVKFAFKLKKTAELEGPASNKLECVDNDSERLVRIKPCVLTENQLDDVTNKLATYGLGKSILYDNESALYCHSNSLNINKNPIIVVSNLETETITRDRFELAEIKMYKKSRLDRYLKETRPESEAPLPTTNLNSANMWPPFLSDNFTLYVRYLPLVRNCPSDSDSTSSEPYSDLIGKTKKIVLKIKAITQNLRF